MMRNVKIQTILLLLFFSLAVLASCSQYSPEEPVASERPPNLIYILADDLGYGELGVYGQELIETPNIDRLAERGMRFTQHYSGSPVCAPSRCVLLTGKHSGHAYVRSNDEWGERGDVWDFAKVVEDPGLEGQRPIPEDTVTIGEMLQSAGYRTAIVGKWGLGAPDTEGVPNRQGFDFFFGYNCQRQAHTYYPQHLWRNDEKVWLDNELVVPHVALEEGADPLDPTSYEKFALEDYAPQLMLEETLGFIERNMDDPFFLYFATPIPHLPLQAPQRWVDYYVDKFGEEEPYTGENRYYPHRYPRAAYAAMISYLDEQVGDIVTRLKELGLYENTVIFFSSDNGPTYTGGADSTFFDSAGPFKTESGWGKGSLHEGGIRVPMIAAWPGQIPEGTESDLTSVFYDMFPTLCEIAEIPFGEKVDGISFLPTLLGEGEQEKHEFVYWEFPSYGGQQAVRMGDWKGLRTGILDGNLEIQLFNLAEDPQELNNVADQNSEIVRQIREIMEREHTVAEIERFRMPTLGD